MSDNTASVPTVEYSEQHFREQFGFNSRPRLLDSFAHHETYEEMLDREAAEEQQEWEQNQMQEQWERNFNPYTGEPRNPFQGFYRLPNGGAMFID